MGSAAIERAGTNDSSSCRCQCAYAPLASRGIIRGSDLPAPLFPELRGAEEPHRKDPMTETFSEFDWRWKPFDDLSALDVYAMLAARSEVFVVEQQCVYGDVDGQDAGAWHLLVYRRSADARPKLAGYLRVLLPSAEGDAEESDIRIGRVLTTAGFRGIGLGQAMLERTLGLIREQWPGQPIRLHAQARLQRFYASFEFEPISDVHVEDDIPHIWMRRI